jgi:hypothetical protein
MQREPIIFLHIPKTAGTTLNRIIDWEYNPLHIFSINGRYFRSSYARLTRCPSSRLARMALFRGHMPFGLHRFLDRPATYITVLRNPIERTISEYYFAVNRRIHREHRQISKLSLEDYVRTSPHNNAQTKLVAGQNDGYDFLAGDCGREMLTVAKENLSRYFRFVGITERFTESLALSKVLLGWRLRRYATFRVTPRRPRTETLTETALRVISEYNCYDMELYDYAMQLFDETLLKYQEIVGREIQSVQRAEVAGSTRLWYYRRIGGAIKIFTLINSAMRCVTITPATRILSSRGMHLSQDERGEH